MYGQSMVEQAQNSHGRPVPKHGTDGPFPLSRLGRILVLEQHLGEG